MKRIELTKIIIVIVVIIFAITWLDTQITSKINLDVEKISRGKVITKIKFDENIRNIYWRKSSICYANEHIPIRVYSDKSIEFTVKVNQLDSNLIFESCIYNKLTKKFVVKYYNYNHVSEKFIVR